MKKLYSILLSSLLCLGACNRGYYATAPRASYSEASKAGMAKRVEGRVVLGYVTSWGKVLPDPTYLTHINYAFAGLYMDGNEYRKFGIQGGQERFDAVKALKKRNPELKILLSFNNTNMNKGGKPGGGFSALAKSPEMRKRFAEDCRRFVEKEGIDGIDIDWEFPGLTYGHAEYDTKVDVDNFTLLMKDLRDALGPDILLTYAGYCKGVQHTGDGGRRYIDVAAVDPYVDFVNIMTYDFDSAPHHQSAFDDPENSWDCRRAVQAYLDAGVPASKLVLGIPFYARHDFQRGGSVRFCNLGTWAEGDGYKTDCWDERAGVPHVGKDGAFHAGYDNPRSIALKGKWLLGLGLKGMMFWEYEGDDEQGTLQRAIWDAVMAKPEPPADAPVRDFIARSADYRSLLADCEKLLGTSQYMAGTLLKVDYAYPGYEGYPVKLYEYYTAPDVKTGEKKRGLVYMLNPSPEKLAKWVAYAVWRAKGSLDLPLMQKLLKFIQWQSGAQFPVCGIVYEDMYGTGQYPYLFKDGVTVYAADRSKWATESPQHPDNYSCTDEQLEYDIRVTNADLQPYTGTYARISSTTREQYAANGGPSSVGKSEPRDARVQDWLSVVRTLYKAAWDSDENTLITAWAKANL